jgi:uncharacterized protein with beta-barrel porin domain
VLTGTLNVNRDSHTATVLQNGKVLIAGGQWNGTILKSCELYDPTSGDFTTTGNLNYARMSHTATLLQNGEVLIVGGTTPLNGSNGFELVAELYNPATGTFSITEASTPEGLVKRQPFFKMVKC